MTNQPCPFCGHESLRMKSLVTSGAWQTECTYCGAEGPTRDPNKGGQIDAYCTDTALDYWNERPVTDELRDTVTNLKVTAQETQAQLADVINALQHLSSTLKEEEESIKDERDPDELRFRIGAIVRLATGQIATEIEDLETLKINLDAIAEEK
jgi:transcription elongation factor Elf1